MELLLNHVMFQAGLSQTAVVRGEDKEALKNAVHDISSSAHVHLEHCMKLRTSLPSTAQLALIGCVPARATLDTLERYDFDVTNGKALQRKALLAMSIKKEAIRLNLVGNWNQMKSGMKPGR